MARLAVKKWQAEHWRKIDLIFENQSMSWMGQRDSLKQIESKWQHLASKQGHGKNEEGGCLILVVTNSNAASNYFLAASSP